MTKTKLKFNLLSIILIFFIAIFGNSLKVEAGTIGSVSANGDKGSDTAVQKYRTPLVWKIQRDIKSEAVLADHIFRDGDTFSMPAYSSIAYVSMKRSGGYTFPNDWTRWKSWFILGHGDPGSAYNQNLWKDWSLGGSQALLPQDFIDQVMDDGYSKIKAGALYKKGADYADGIWIEGLFQKTASAEVKSIVSFSNSADPSQNFDNSAQSNEWHFNNPRTSVDFNYSSVEDQYNFTHTITVTQKTFTKDSIWTENSGGVKFDITDTYSSINPVSANKIASWSTDAPSLSYIYFRPFDLRTEKVLGIDILKNNGYNSNLSDLALSIEVDNYQEKIDEANPIDIPTIDTNIPRKFKVKFLNEQFGIPLKQDGGIDISKSKPAFSPEIDGVQVYWDAKLNMASSVTCYSPSRTSLEFDKSEKLGSDTIVKPMGFLGGNFNFRSIKTGSYWLGAFGKPFWIADYETGIYFKYGAKYSATVSTGSPGPVFSPLNSFGNIEITDNKIWLGQVTSSVKQPVLYAPFKVSTVGGYKK